MRPNRSYSSTSKSRQAGFSLVWASVLLTVGAIIMASVIPGQGAGDFNAKSIATMLKLQRIEEATRAFMTLNSRRPCPADGQYAVGNIYFGVEAASAGTCTGSTPAAPFGPDAGTGNVVGGVVPTKSLGVPDDYAFDEWGRRITYVVDRRATSIGACYNLMKSISLGTSTSAIQIETTTGGTVLDTPTAAYISHGPDGHGAFPAAGSLVTGRINSGSTNQDQNTNAGSSNDGNMTYSTSYFTGVKVQKPKTTGFDDLVYYRQDLKSICCLGSSCAPTGFSGSGVSASDLAGSSLAVGDVNGDGIPDLIIGAPGRNSNAGVVYVVFGTKAGFPDPLPLSTLNGSNGFELDGVTSGDLVGTSLAVGDINHDGTSDIIIGAPGRNGSAGSAYVIYGGTTRKDGTAWSSCPCTLSGTFTNGTNGFRLDGQIGSGAGTSVAAGDVYGHNNGTKDVVIGAPGNNSNTGSVYIGYGGTAMMDGTAWTACPCQLPLGTVLYDTFSTNGSLGSHTMDIGSGWNPYCGAWAISGNPGNGIADVTATCGSQTNLAFANANSATVTETAKITLSGYGTGVAGLIGRASWNGGGYWNGMFAAEISLSGGSGDPDHISIWEDKLGSWAEKATTSCGGTYAFYPAGATYNVNVVYSGNTITASTVSNFGPCSVTYTSPTGDFNTATYFGLMNEITGGNEPESKFDNFQVVNISVADGFELDGANSGDKVGTSVAAGDVNADGKADIIIGAPGFSSSKGATYVVFGSSSLTGSYTLGQMITSGTNGFELDGQASDSAGTSVATGDINGDGTADIIIGAPGHNSNTGAVYSVFGGTTMKDGTSWTICPCTLPIGTSLLYDTFTDVIGTTFLQNHPMNIGSGWSIWPYSNPTMGTATNGTRAHPVMNDYQTGYGPNLAWANGGQQNVIVSAVVQPTDPSDNTTMGVFGRYTHINSCNEVAALLDAQHSTFNLYECMTGTGYTLATVPFPYAVGTYTINLKFNGSTASATITGNGMYASIPSTAIDVSMNGTQYGLFDPRTTEYFDNFVTFGGSGVATNGFEIDGAAISDKAGTSVTVGDVNADGYGDIIIGAPGHNSSTGAAYAIFGAASGWSSTMNVSALTGSNGFELDGISASDLLGTAVATGDINNDGKNDFIVGAPGRSSSAGAIYIDFGKKTWTTPISASGL